VLFMSNLIIEPVSLYNHEIRKTIKPEYLFENVCKNLGPPIINAANFCTDVDIPNYYRKYSASLVLVLIYIYNL
jgi:hypothetical protein